MDAERLAPTVAEAADRVSPHVVRTPVLRFRDFEFELGAEVLFKAEPFQRTGSFKIRGATNKLLALSDEERARGVVTFSAGNHAQALACACAELGVDCHVVMWRTANPMKVAATRFWGASIDLEAEDSSEAADRLADAVRETGRVMVHPFDDADVIAGQGTATLELLEEAGDLEVLLVPTSGGGLIAGAVLACEAHRSSAEVIAVQPQASQSLRHALDEGAPRRFQPGLTAADALAAPFFGQLNFEIVNERVSTVVTVSEGEIAAGVRWCYSRAKLAVEPGGAVTVAALLAGRVDLGDRRRVGVIVSGANADPAVISRMITSQA